MNRGVTPHYDDEDETFVGYLKSIFDIRAATQACTKTGGRGGGYAGYR